MTIVQHSDNSGLVLDSDQSWWSERQIAGLRQVGIDQATDGDLLVFFHVCQRTGLDPFARQIHMVSRNTKDGNQWVKKWTIQTGIDGFRLVADRADRRDRTMREYEETLWADPEGKWTDVWTSAHAPTAAKVTVIRNGKRFPATVLYREFVQTTRDGNPNSMWARMPANQLAKCAEAAALRKAYPQDLSGIYSDEEMGQADNPEPGRRGGLAAALGETTHTAEQIPDEPVSSVDHPDDSKRLDPKSSLGRKMFATLGDAGITEKEARLAYVSDVVGREITTSTELTEDEASRVIDAVQADLDQPFPEAGSDA